jgi:hypothetical protein
MCKKLIYLMLCVLVLGVTGSASAGLIAHWPFDESSGTTVHDVVGGINGTIQGDPAWVAGVINNALAFDGKGDIVRIPTNSVLHLQTPNYTVSVWVYVVNTAGGVIIFNGQGCQDWAKWYLGVGHGENDAPTFGGTSVPNNFVFGVRLGGPTDANYVAAPFVPETWMHVAVTFDGTALKMYIDGEEADSSDTTTLPANNSLPLNIGGDPGCVAGGRDFFTGKIDDLRIYDEALSQANIQVIMTPTIAWKPNPADRGYVSGTNPTLSWKFGKYAAKHNVYFGTSSADVIAATKNNHENVQVSLEQDPNNYVPPGPLVFGQTYYWRIDEVNDAHPNKLWIGTVWSFTVQPLTAYYPSPVDGAKYLDPNVILSWSPGVGAKSHDVYLGTDPGNLPLVSDGQLETTYDAETLNYDTTYYWRIIEFDGTSTHVGHIWSFSILPVIPITDPHLVGWWKFDEGLGTRAVDWSGYNRHGTIYGDPNWVEGYDGGALSFNGIDNYVDLPIDSLIPSLTSCTITTWVDYLPLEGGPWQRIFGFFNPNGLESYMTLTPRSGDSGPMTFAIVTNFTSPYPGTETDQLIAPATLESGWHHVAVVIDGASMQMQLYLDDTVVAAGTTTTLPADLHNVISNTLGHTVHGLEAYFTGLLDDFRIYDITLTQDDIALVMRVNPLLAWKPIPRNGSTPDIEHIETISWSPGVKAAKHDVYFGTDFDDVNDVNTSDTTGIYRNRHDPNTYTPPEGFQWGKTYYWRIDEYNTDASISTGLVWSFTIANYLVVDDFEDYNNNTPDRVFQTWKDGFGYTGYHGNGTGSTVGHDIWSPDSPYYQSDIVETSIVNSSAQSMPIYYDNTATTKNFYEEPINLYYSEVNRVWDTPQDWTRQAVADLTIRFRGHRQSVGGISYDAVSKTYTMTAAGTDIWDVPGPVNQTFFHDEFHFAYKRLYGEAQITAKVEKTRTLMNGPRQA